GLGWFLEDFNGFKRVSHGGGLWGMIYYPSPVPRVNLRGTVLTHAEEGGKSTANALALTQPHSRGPPRGWGTGERGLKADEAQEHAEGDAKRKPEPIPGLDLTKLDIAPYVGTFKDPWRGEATITQAADGLTLTFSHTKELTGHLTPIRPGLFVVRWKNR